MKKTVATALLAFAGFLNTNADTITIVADEWAPYNGVEGSATPGYMIEIAQLVFAEAGHTVDYKNINWARAIADTREGKFSAIVGAAHGDAPDFAFPAEPLGNMLNYVWVKADSDFTFNGSASLDGKKAGFILDYDYGEDLNAYIEAHKDSPAVQVIGGDAPLELNIKKLERGRIDLMIEDKNVFLNKAEALGLKGKFRPAGTVTEEGESLFIAFSPANPKSTEYAKILSDGLAKLRENGQLAEILARYGLEDWK